MKLFAVLLLCTIGMAYSATLNVNPQCSVCTTTLDWVRSNENVLSFMKTDEEVSDELMALLESDVASEDVCAQFSMCETDADEDEYLTVLRGGGGRLRRKGRKIRQVKKPRGHGDPDCAINGNC